MQAFLDKDGYVNYQLTDQNGQKIEDKVRNSKYWTIIPSTGLKIDTVKYDSYREVPEYTLWYRQVYFLNFLCTTVSWVFYAIPGQKI